MKTFAVETAYIRSVSPLLCDCSRIAQPYLCRSNEPLPNYVQTMFASPLLVLSVVVLLPFSSHELVDQSFLFVHCALHSSAGGEIVSTFGHPEKVRLGSCKLIEEVMIGEDKLIRFSGTHCA